MIDSPREDHNQSETDAYLGSRLHGLPLSILGTFLSPVLPGLHTIQRCPESTQIPRGAGLFFILRDFEAQDARGVLSNENVTSLRRSEHEAT